MINLNRNFFLLRFTKAPLKILNKTRVTNYKLIITKSSVLILLEHGLFNVKILTMYGLDTFNFDICHYSLKSVIYLTKCLINKIKCGIITIYCGSSR